MVFAGPGFVYGLVLPGSGGGVLPARAGSLRDPTPPPTSAGPGGVFAECKTTPSPQLRHGAVPLSGLVRARVGGGAPCHWRSGNLAPPPPLRSQRGKPAARAGPERCSTPRSDTCCRGRGAGAPCHLRSGRPPPPAPAEAIGAATIGRLRVPGGGPHAGAPPPGPGGPHAAQALTRSI
jgi:hypothetical protein